MGVLNLFDLRNKVALVTGGSRGIGFQMAEALGEMGAKVAVTARKQDELEVACAHLAARDIPCLAVSNDLADFTSIPSLVDAVLGKWQSIDILVNNAGMQLGRLRGGASGCRVAQGDGPQCRRAVLPRARGRQALDDPRRGGKIVNIASIAGLTGNSPNWGLSTVGYNTSKGALLSMTRALAAEWGRSDIQRERHLPRLLPVEDEQRIAWAASKRSCASAPRWVAWGARRISKAPQCSSRPKRRGTSQGRPSS